MAGRSVSFLHLLTSGASCTYFHQLQPPTIAECARVRGCAADWLQQNTSLFYRLEDYYSAPGDSPPFTPASPNELLSAEFNGLNMWAVIRPSLGALFQWDDVETGVQHATPTEWSSIVELFKAACASLIALEKFLAEQRPTHCILFNGFFYLERLMVESCRKATVQVIGTESSTFADRKHYSTTGVAGNRNELRGLGAELAYARALLYHEQTRLEQFFAEKLQGGNGTIPQPPSSIRFKADLGIDASTRLALFLGQVPHDSVMLSDAMAFRTQTEAISALFDLFSKPPLSSMHLAVRLHPGGEITSMRQDVMAERLSETHPMKNVTVFRGVECNTYDLMQLADAAITFTSQAGLEFLWLKKPLITLGPAYYAGHGFTIDVQRRETLLSALKHALSGNYVTPDVKRRIDVFLYALVFEYLVPINRAQGSVQDDGVVMIANLLSGRHRLYGVSRA